MKKSFITALSALLLFAAPQIAKAKDVEGTSPKVTQKTNSQKLDPIFRDFRIAVGGGYAYQLGKRMKYNDPVYDQLSKDLMGGYNIGLDMQYFFKEYWGLGLDLSYVKSNADYSSLVKMNNRYIYAGPTFATRYETDKFLFVATIGIGAQFYKQTATADHKSSYNKTVFASNLDISGEYKIAENFGLGLNIAFAGGTMSNPYPNNYSTKNENISLSNFTVGTFVSYYFKNSK